MYTKIKMPLIAFMLIVSLPLCAQRPFRQVQIEMDPSESVASFTTTYVRHTASRPTEIRVEKQTYQPTYATGNESDGWASSATCRSPYPTNLEEVACLISDAALASRRSLNGEVELQVLIDSQGKYLSHRLISMEYTPLMAATEKQIDQIRFRPAQQQGQAIACWVDLRFVFEE